MCTPLTHIFSPVDFSVKRWKHGWLFVTFHFLLIGHVEFKRRPYGSQYGSSFQSYSGRWNRTCFRYLIFAIFCPNQLIQHLNQLKSIYPFHNKPTENLTNLWKRTIGRIRKVTLLHWLNVFLSKSRPLDGFIGRKRARFHVFIAVLVIGPLQLCKFNRAKQIQFKGSKKKIKKIKEETKIFVRPEKPSLNRGGGPKAQQPFTPGSMWPRWLTWQRQNPQNDLNDSCNILYLCLSTKARHCLVLQQVYKYHDSLPADTVEEASQRTDETSSKKSRANPVAPPPTEVPSDGILSSLLCTCENPHLRMSLSKNRNKDMFNYYLQEWFWTV